MEDWYAANASWWAAVAEALPKPWPEEACLQDLRWWADQERRGLAARPGRGKLAERWGVAPYVARRLIEGGAWACPIVRKKPVAARPGAPVRDRLRVLHGGSPKDARTSPGLRQPFARTSPGGGTANADNPEDFASGSPAVRQDVASGSPAGAPPRAHAGGDARAGAPIPRSEVRDRGSSPPTPAPGERGPSGSPPVEDEPRTVMAAAIERLMATTTHTADWHRRLRIGDQTTIDAVRASLKAHRALPTGVRRRDIAEACLVALDRWEAEHGPIPPGRAWSPAAGASGSAEGDASAASTANASGQPGEDASVLEPTDTSAVARAADVLELLWSDELPADVDALRRGDAAAVAALQAQLLRAGAPTSSRVLRAAIPIALGRLGAP